MDAVCQKLLAAACSIANQSAESILSDIASYPGKDGGHSDWRYYVPEVVRECWLELPLSAQLVAFTMSEARSQSECLD